MSVSVGSRQRWQFFVAAVLAVVAADDVRGQTGAATFTVLPHFDPSAANRGEAAYDVTNQGVVVGYGVASDSSIRAAI